MCEFCGKGEHPLSCCNLLNLIRMAYGAEQLPTSPLEMGVKPPCGSLADLKHLVALDNQKIRRLREKVDRLLKKYEEG